MQQKTILGAVVIIALLACGFAVWKLHSAPETSTLPSTLTIDANSGNYGLFINSQDNGYFSTTDANVKKVVQAYLIKPEAKTDSDKYGSSLVFYYTKDVFIKAELFSSTDRNSISGFTMHDMKSGKQISPCYIFPQAGLYKDNDLLLSVSYTEPVPGAKNGVCFYERGASNFTFIDLTSKLSTDEILFSDPTGQSLKANIKDIDTKKKTFAVDVYDTTKKDRSGNYIYKRSIEISY